MTEQEFIKETEKLNIKITEKMLEQLNEYYNLLIEENKIQNLTRIEEKKEVYLKHFYDSLTISKAEDLNQDLKIIDVGTGAGFPGLVLKIVYPHLDITLLDALDKRIKFLNKVIKTLDLKNIKTVHSRIEDYNEKFDVVTSRAVAKTNILLELSYKLCKEKGYFILLKSNTEEELNDSANALEKLNLKLERKEEFYLPIENSKRTILKILKEKEVKKYPRKFAQIKKNPL